MIEKKQTIMTSGKQLDTIVYPPNKPHYCVSGLLMDYPLEKLFGWCFLIGFNQASYILGNWSFLRISKWKKTKKEINWKENTLASKGKGKGNDWKKQKIMASGKQLDTIVYPPNKPHYCVPGCNFLWKGHLENFNDGKIKSKRKKL